MTVDKKVEMRRIPDYPNYAVTKDGRVWSYNKNNFMSPYPRNKQGNIVYLWNGGIKFCKYVRRLVFETFTDTIPECVIHEDGNIFNDKFENLKPISRSEVSRNVLKQREHSTRRICKIEISTRKFEVIKVPVKDKSYTRIHQVVVRRALSSGGCLYYYPDEKGELVSEIKAHIYSNELSLKRLFLQDKYSPFIPIIKKHIRVHKNYLEILESV